MMKISAVIITKNEERNIARCLESLSGIADEVIIVDSFSTDKTKEICRSYNAVFVEQEWLGYGEQKNIGNAKASYDYILSLDADEALSSELRKSILQIKENGTHDAYSFNRLNIYCGKPIRHCGWYPDKKIRLWNRGKGKWDNAEVHEQLELQQGTTVKHIKGDILHNTYYTTSQHLEKIQKYSDLWVQKAIKRGKKVSLLKLMVVDQFRFFSSYILRLGFLDGASGWTLSKMIAYEAFLKYNKLYQHYKTPPYLKFEGAYIDYVNGREDTADNKFSILLPTWNNLPCLQLCVNSIRKNSRFKHQIVVHINEGNDGTLEWVKEQGLDYSYSEQNVGVCHAVNAAYRLAKTDYLLYINDDMYVAPDWDLYLWEEIEKTDGNKYYFSATAIEPYPSRTNHHYVGSFGTSPADFREEEFLQSYESFTMGDWSGSSFPPSIMHRDMWDAVGGYSVEYSPGMYSDPDLSMKLWKKGVRNFKGIAKSKVYHFGRSSTKRLKRRDSSWAKKHFLKKWGISSRTFYKYYLRMGEPYKGFQRKPGLSFGYLLKLLSCKIRKFL